jgi:hypothetical protein
LTTAATKKRKLHTLASSGKSASSTDESEEEKKVNLKWSVITQICEINSTTNCQGFRGDEDSF